MQFCFLHASCFFSLMCFYLQFYFWFLWTAFGISIFFHWSISFIVTWIMNSNYNFISNNVKGIKASEKCLKLFEYLRNKINNNGFVFSQETHLSLKDEQKWKDGFKESSIFSYGKVILVVWQSAIGKQELLKWLTWYVTEMDEF